MTAATSSTVNPPHILLVDDDEDITALLAGYLARFRFTTVCACDAASMRAVLAREAVDLIVLDWMLPGTDGLSLAREVRAQSRIPVIMLTARASAFDAVVGLETGVDDYVSKPFEPRELVARIRTVLRRSAGAPRAETSAHEMWFDGWRLNRSVRRLTSPSGAAVRLSDAEFRLLCTFLKKPRALFTRDQLMTLARGRRLDSFERSIDLLVSRLRHKLVHDPLAPSIIRTVRGAGYLFDAHSVQEASACVP